MKTLELIVLGLPVRSDEAWFVDAAHFRFGLGFIVDIETDGGAQLSFFNIKRVTWLEGRLLIIESPQGAKEKVTLTAGRVKILKARRGFGKFKEVKNGALLSSV